MGLSVQTEHPDGVFDYLQLKYHCRYERVDGNGPCNTESALAWFWGGGVGEEEENKTAYSGVMQVHGSLHFLSLKLRLFRS